jgi:hypothetical protein
VSMYDIMEGESESERPNRIFYYIILLISLE